MKGLVKSKASEGLWLKDVPVPEIGINDVLAKILKTSICGTDVHIWNWDAWAEKNIRVGTMIGHEFVGLVEDFGSNVRDYRKGDLVSGEGHIVCGRCRNCLAGRRHLCPHTNCIGVERDGAHAEYLSIPVTNVWPCDPKIPLEILSCFEPLGNATHTALSFDLLGEDILITGAGPVGLFATAVARHCSARHIVVTDVNPYVLDDIHEIDCHLWLFGRVEDIFCRAAKLSNLQMDSEDYAEISLSFSSGVISQIHMDFLAKSRTRGCEIVGQKGILLWEERGKPSECSVKFYSDKDRKWCDLFGPATTDGNECYLQQLRELFAVVEGADRKTIANGKEGLYSLKVALAAQKSADTKQVIVL